jgi:hypothetical protein
MRGNMRGMNFRGYPWLINTPRNAKQDADILGSVIVQCYKL